MGFQGCSIPKLRKVPPAGASRVPTPIATLSARSQVTRPPPSYLEMELLNDIFRVDSMHAHMPVFDVSCVFGLCTG